MELFTKLFSGVLLFVYHCFDRIVINGYLSGLSRPEHNRFCEAIRREKVLRFGARTPQTWQVESLIIRGCRGTPSIRVACGVRRTVHQWRRSAPAESLPPTKLAFFPQARRRR